MVFMLNHDSTYIDNVLKSTTFFALDMAPPNDPTFIANDGVSYRRKLTQKSKIIDLMGKPLIFPWETTKLIPSTTRWQFDFTLAPSNFILKWALAEAGSPFKYQIIRAELIIMRVELSQRANSSLPTLLQREQHLLYPFVDYSLNNFSLPTGQKEFRIQNTTLPGYPRRMFVFMIKEATLIGDPQECPFW